MQAAVKALSTNRSVPLGSSSFCQIVHIECGGGQPVRMSRSAPAPTSQCAIWLDEVGKDAVRFTMLTRKSDAQMEFDLDQAVAADPRQPGVLRYASTPTPAAARSCAPRPRMFGLGSSDVTDASLADTPWSRWPPRQNCLLIRRLSAQWPAHRRSRLTGT